MTRRIKRSKNFELLLEITNEDFIKPPREAQRNWLLNQALAEMVDDIQALDEIAKNFVPGQEFRPIDHNSQSSPSDEEIMENWQIPIMDTMAQLISGREKDILEIGFGRGISAEFIQKYGARSHTIIECEEPIVERYHQWAAQYPKRNIKVIHSRWEDCLGQLASFDGVFFHTYAMDAEEYIDHALQSVTYAEHFFETAASLLKSGGIFTYLTNEIDSVSRRHQRLLLRHFNRFTVQKASNLKLSQNVKDTWWADSMMVVGAIKEDQA